MVDPDTVYDVDKLIREILISIGYDENRIRIDHSYYSHTMLMVKVVKEAYSSDPQLEFNVNIHDKGICKVKIIPSTLPPINLAEEDSIALIKHAILQVPVWKVISDISTHISTLSESLSKVGTSLNDLLYRLEDNPQ
jgi:hypothetical protein